MNLNLPVAVVALLAIRTVHMSHHMDIGMGGIEMADGMGGIGTAAVRRHLTAGKETVARVRALVRKESGPRKEPSEAAAENEWTGQESNQSEKWSAEVPLRLRKRRRRKKAIGMLRQTL